MKFVTAILLLSATLCLPFTAGAQATQTITGAVYDEAAHATLSGATIVLVNTTNGTTTATDGSFRLTNVPIGRQSFRISYLGYEERIVADVLVTAGKEVQLNIGLQESLKQMAEVTVKATGKAKDKTRTNNDMAQVSARAFNMDETKRYAGALGDPSRMAASFAGVSAGNDARNDIVVRGNSPAGMLWQLEGLNIPNPNHYGSLGSTGGPVSMLNNNNLDKSDFMTSAFPAQYGNAVSGVFDLKLREGNHDKPEFVAQMGFNGFEAGAEGPIGKNKQTSYLINYRYSTLGVFKKIGIDFGTGSATPIYQDVNYKITTKLSPKSKLTLFGIAGNSSADMLGKEVDTNNIGLYGGDPYANNRNKFSTTVTGLSYEQQLSPKTATKLTLGYSTTMEKSDGDSISNVDGSVMPDYDTKFKTQKLSAVWSLMHKLDAKNNFQAGIIYDYTRFNLLNRDLDPVKPTRVYIDQSGGYGLAQSYAQWKHRFSEKLSMVGGLHVQYLSINSKVSVEPRASIRYAFNGKQAISLGYGLHAQAQNVYTYYVETTTPEGQITTNKDLGFTRSQQFVATYDWNVTRSLRIKAEGYYQQLSNVPVEQRSTSYSALNTGADFGMVDADSLVNKGRGYNYGLELTAERFFSQGYYFLATGSLFRSRYKGSDGIERNTAFNTGYALNLLGGKEFKLGTKGSVIALNLKLTVVGGRYLTPIDFAASKAQGKVVYRDELAFTERQPDYLRADLRIAYRKEFKRSTLELAIDFQNVTNHQNVFGQTYNNRTGKLETTYQQGFFPMPLIRYTF